MHSTTIHVRLRTISPLHIGCGEVYEPVAFAVDETNRELVSFDPTALLEQLDDDELAKFSAICRKGTIPSLVEVYNFVNRHKDLVEGDRVAVPQAFVEQYQKTLLLRDRAVERELNQFKIERTAFNSLDGRPYIPGSAVKGAIRTAVLNLRNGGRPGRGGNAGALESRLTGGTFQDDPFRLVKVSDFMPMGDVERRVVYAVNRKKKPTEREAQAPYQIFEVVEEGMEFFGTITVLDPRQAGMTRPVSLEEIDRAIHTFYDGELARERKQAVAAGCEADAYPGRQDKVPVLRVGRHSGAECVTIEGCRDIRIMLAKGVKEKKSLPYATTLWFAANSPRPSTGRFLRPFGWVAMALLAGGEAAHCAGAVAASADSWRREQERKLTAFRERAERLRATALEAEQQRRALAERQRIEEELDRKYPWRKLLPPLESIDNWGDLRHKALDDEGLLTHRAEPEVGRAVRAAAERVRAARPKKWDAERDAVLAGWLEPSAVPWSVQAGAPTAGLPPGALSAEEKARVETLAALRDWGEYKTLAPVMGELTRTEAEALRGVFASWGLKKAKNADKKQALKDLEAHLAALRKKG